MAHQQGAGATLLASETARLDDGKWDAGGAHECLRLELVEEDRRTISGGWVRLGRAHTREQDKPEAAESDGRHIGRLRECYECCKGER